MGEVVRLSRKTIHAFLRNYHSYASIAAILVFPAAACILLSQAFIGFSPDLIHAVQFRVQSLFSVAGFPNSTGFFSLLNLKLSQTIISLAFTIPFTLTFLVLAKAATVHTFFCSQEGRQSTLSFASFIHLYVPIVQTCIMNYFTILSANAAVFSFLFVAFNVAGILQVSSAAADIILSVAGGIIYSIVLANVVVACNLAVVISGHENKGGCLQILKAFLIVRGRTSIALSLSLPTNLSMAAIEALFQYRVMRAYKNSSSLPFSTMSEAFTIAYLYSIISVLDVLATCMFFKSCKLRNLPTHESEIYHYANELLDKDEECTESVCSKS